MLEIAKAQILYLDDVLRRKDFIFDKIVCILYVYLWIKNIIHTFVAKIGIPLAEDLWIFLRLKISIILIKLFAPLRFPTNLHNPLNLRANITASFGSVKIYVNCGKIAINPKNSPVQNNGTPEFPFLLLSAYSDPSY